MSGKLRFLPFMLAVCCGLAALAAIVGFLVRGLPGAAGAALGVLLMTGLFVASTAFIVWVESVNRQKMLLGGLLAYGLKLWILFVILNGIAGMNWTGFVPTVFGVAAGVIGWITGYAWWLWHAKIPYVEL